jgi:hypothetical protein
VIRNVAKEKLSWAEASRRRRAELREFDLSHSGADKTERIDLGLALLSLHAVPGRLLPAGLSATACSWANEERTLCTACARQPFTAKATV